MAASKPIQVGTTLHDGGGVGQAGMSPYCRMPTARSGKASHGGVGSTLMAGVPYNLAYAYPYQVL